MAVTRPPVHKNITYLCHTGLLQGPYGENKRMPVGQFAPSGGYPYFNQSVYPNYPPSPSHREKN